MAPGERWRRSVQRVAQPDVWLGFMQRPRCWLRRSGWGRRSLATLVYGDVLRLPFATTCADAVFVGGLLPHLADSLAALREIARVTRSGGALAVSSCFVSLRHIHSSHFLCFPTSLCVAVTHSRLRSPHPLLLPMPARVAQSILDASPLHPAVTHTALSGSRRRSARQGESSACSLRAIARSV